MSKKAVIETGSKQYIVEEGQIIDVERINSESKTIEFSPLLIIDGDKVSVGAPSVNGVTVLGEILSEKKDDKVTAIRYKAKKRVKKVRGHRQIKTQVKINKIS